MKSVLPEINNRSITPSNAKNSDRKYKPALVSAPKTLRNISLGPMSTRNSRRDSSDIFSNLRPISNQDQSFQLERATFLSRLNTTIAKSSKITKAYLKEPVFPNYHQVINAIFSIYSCEKQRIQANNLISLFQGIGFCDSLEILIDVFQGVTEGLAVSMISYSKQDLIKLCEDVKTENLLRIIMKETINSGLNKEKSLDGPINIIKKWWNRLDKSHSGSVQFEEIVNFLTDIEVVQSSSDIKRMFLKIGQVSNFKQFFNIFGKSLLRFMLQELGKVVSEGKIQYVSPELTILALRRRHVLGCLSGDGNIRN